MKYLQTFTLLALLLVCSDIDAQTMASKKWKLTIGTPNDSIPYANTMAWDTVGNLVMTGNTNHLTEKDNIFIVKLSPTGDTAWTREWNSPDNESDFAVKVVVQGAISM